MTRTFRAAIAVLAFAAAAAAQVPVALTPVPRYQFFGSNGLPLSGGKICTYAAGTTTPLATYTDSTGMTPNTNPVLLDAGGWPVSGSSPVSIWLSNAAYKIVVLTPGTDNTCATGTTVYSVDGVYEPGQQLQGNLAGSTGATYVGFQYPGSATTRTAAQRLADTADAKDFGAVADGTTDDSAAIQAVVNASLAGPAALLSGGTYLVNTTVTAGNNAALIAQNATLKRGANVPALTVTGNNFIARDLSVAGRETANPTWHSAAVYVNGASNVTFERLTISDQVSNGLSAGNYGFYCQNCNGLRLLYPNITAGGGGGANADGATVRISGDSAGAGSNANNVLIVGGMLTNPSCPTPGTCGNVLRVDRTSNDNTYTVSNLTVTGTTIVNGAGRFGTEFFSPSAQFPCPSAPCGVGAPAIYGPNISQMNYVATAADSGAVSFSNVIGGGLYSSTINHGGFSTSLMGVAELGPSNGVVIQGNTETLCANIKASIVIDSGGAGDVLTANTFCGYGHWFFNAGQSISRTADQIGPGNVFVWNNGSTTGIGGVGWQATVGYSDSLTHSTIQGNQFLNVTTGGSSDNTVAAINLANVGSGGMHGTLSDILISNNQASGFYNGFQDASSGGSTMSNIYLVSNDWNATSQFHSGSAAGDEVTQATDVGYTQLIPQAVKAKTFVGTSAAAINSGGSSCGASLALGAGSTENAGYYTSNTSGSCTVQLTFPDAAPHLYACSVFNATTTADQQAFTPNDTTHVTFSGTTVSGDNVFYSCQPF